LTLRDTVAGASLVVVSTVLAACGGSASGSQAGNNAGVCGGQTGVSTATSQTYVVVLVATTQVGPGVATPQASPSPTPAPPAVLSGTEAAIIGAGATHLELHVCNRSTGAVVTGLHPEVTLRNVNGGAPLTLPVAVVQDAGQGVNGTAYANNVRLDGEQTYAVDVRIDAADSVELSYEAPVTGPTPPPPAGCLDNHQLC
jgi:hypothetical protein